MESINVVARFRGSESTDDELATWKITQNSVSNKERYRDFTLDAVLDPSQSQSVLYEKSASSAVINFMDGYNATVFAYGQSGSGKTYSMLGPEAVTEVLVSQSSKVSSETESLFGVIPRATFHIFDLMTSGKLQGTKYMIKVSYLEIYNECVNDILAVPVTHNLKIREFPNQGMCVIGMQEAVVTCPENIFECISSGTVNKIVCSTGQNSRSSRSHTVFVISCEQWLVDGSSKLSKLNLVDLAGSEKLSKTGAQGQALKEAQKINLSLTTLGRCIKALTSNEHVPFRESKLTLILRESLGGNSKTSLIVTASMRQVHEDETISTLMFAERAKLVKTTARSNVKRSVEELELMIEQLKAEIARLKEQLKKGGTIISDSEELQELRAKYLMLQNSSSLKIEELVDALERNKNQVNQDYLQERNGFISRVDVLEGSLAELEEQRKKQDQEKSKFLKEIERLKQANIELEIKGKEKDKLLDTVKKDLVSSENERIKLAEETRKINLEQAECKEMLVESREDLREFQIKNSQLQSQLEEIVKILENLEKEKEESNQLIEKLEFFSHHASSKLEQANEDHQIEVNELNQKIEELIAENIKLKTQSIESTLDSEFLTESAQQNEPGLFKTNQEIHEMTRKLAKMTEERKKITKELLQVKKALQENEEFFRLKEKFSQTFAIFQDRLKYLESELSKENGKNQKLSKELSLFEEMRERQIKNIENSLRTKMQITIDSLNRRESELLMKLKQRENKESKEGLHKRDVELTESKSIIDQLKFDNKKLARDIEITTEQFMEEKETWKMINSEKTNEIIKLTSEMTEKDAKINSLKKEVMNLQGMFQARYREEEGLFDNSRSLFKKKQEVVPTARVKTLYVDIDALDINEDDS